MTTEETLITQTEKLKEDHDAYFYNIFINYLKKEDQPKTSENYLNFGTFFDICSKDEGLLEKFTLQAQILATRIKCKEILNQISAEISNPNSKVKKSILYYLKGKILHLSNIEHNNHAEVSLQKAVKLDPTMVNAWNELAEAYWRRGDIKQSKNCLEHAMEHSNSQNIVTLRLISTLLRLELCGESPKERCNIILKSVDLAKKAVALNVNSGESWYTLGNAYLSLVFAGLADVKQSNIAYEKAKSVEKLTFFNQDLHFNQSQLHLFLGEFKLALNSLKFANILDPNWKDLTNKIIIVQKYLLEIKKQIDSKGKLKNKKLKLFREKLDEKNVNSGVVISSINNDKKDILAFTAIILQANNELLVIRITNIIQGGNIIIGDILEYANELKVQSTDLTLEYDPTEICPVSSTSSTTKSTTKNAMISTDISFNYVNITVPEKELIINGKLTSSQFSSLTTVSYHRTQNEIKT